ncbi:MAG: response regulator [Planctomycetes bacterium]|nr:response regulator [Planctomycetota bacterium]
MNAPQNAKKKILVIDDELSIVKYLEALLQDNGYATVAAMNGNEAMEKVRSEKPDLICLDITMPEKSGIRFYKELREDPNVAAIPVIVVTAVTGYGGDSETFRKFLSDRRQFPPPNDFIAKPIDREEFIKRVAKVLAAAS